MQVKSWKSMAVCLVSVLVLAAFAWPATAGSEGEQKVLVKKTVKCEDGDCSETVENLGDGEHVEIIVGDDMTKRVKIHKIECDGEDCPESGGIHKMVFVGDDGDVRVMAGDGGHAWVSHSGMHGGGFLGVGLTELTPELRAHFGVPQDRGVMVSKVIDESAALKAGIAVGDIITGVDGNRVADGSALGSMIRGHEDGDDVVLEVWRDGAVRSITAAVEERKGYHTAERMGSLDERMAELDERIGDVGKRVRKIVIDCGSDDEECAANADVAGLDEFDCGGAEECEVKVECEDGSCTCTINGEDADCGGIPGVPGE